MHDVYFCESHVEQWDNQHYFCDCCYNYLSKELVMVTPSKRRKLWYARVKWYDKNKMKINV